MKRGNAICAIVLIGIIGLAIVSLMFSSARPGPVTIDPNATFSGYIETEHDSRFHSIRVYENVTGIHIILNCGWNDFDLYGREGDLPSRSYYDFSSIASGGEDYYYSYPEPGIWHLMVYSYTGIGQYNLIIEFDYD